MFGDGNCALRRLASVPVRASRAKLHSQHVGPPQQKCFPIWFLIANRVTQKCDTFIFVDWVLVQSMNLIHGVGAHGVECYQKPYRGARLLSGLRARKVHFCVGRSKRSLTASARSGRMVVPTVESFLRPPIQRALFIMLFDTWPCRKFLSSGILMRVAAE